MVGAKIDEQIIAFHPLCERTIGLPQPACKTRRQHILVRSPEPSRRAHSVGARRKRLPAIHW
jgi:hypothetical protein